MRIMRTGQGRAEVPQVALLLETSTEYGRGLLRGILRFSRLHGPWSLCVAPGHFDQALPKARSWKGNGILIVGLNGSGKTTLAAKMRALGAHPIADNYGLVSADGVLIPFPELERTELVPADQKTLFCAFGKRFAQTVTIWPRPVPLSTVLLLSRSDQFRISLLTPASTLEGLSVVHRLTPEFIEHSPLALLDAQPSWMDANVRPESDLATTWPDRVVRSMRDARAYSVSVTPEMLLETTRVQQLLDLASATRVQ